MALFEKPREYPCQIDREREREGERQRYFLTRKRNPRLLGYKSCKGRHIFVYNNQGCVKRQVIQDAIDDHIMTIRDLLLDNVYDYIVEEFCTTFFSSQFLVDVYTFSDCYSS